MILLFKRIFTTLLCFMQIFMLSHGMKGGDYVTKANVNFLIQPHKTMQTVGGFGTSACWWAQDVGEGESAEEITRLLYSKEGLGLNIYRYNIGGGEKENPSSRISGNRATESFYYYDAETGQYAYDFSRDAAAQKTLRLALSYGCVDTVVLFANSPHYSMTVSGQATGGTEAYTSNLPPENYEAYADYFITITRHFIEEGVPVKYISPINEPQWSWGGEWVGQEGCHYEPDEVIALLKVFAQKLAGSGLDVKLMAPESGELSDQTIDWFDRLSADEDIAAVLGSLAYHSYWSDDNIPLKYDFGKKLAEKDYAYPVDMTEWCELPLAHDCSDFDAAMRMARVINQDLTLSGANSWSAWVGVNTYGLDENGNRRSDGLISANGDGTDHEIAMRYYALAHFSKFIPAGSVRVTAKTDLFDASLEEKDNYYLTGVDHSAYKTPDGKIVLVVINSGVERNFSILCAGRITGTLWQSTADSQISEKKLCSLYSIPLPENSISTVVLS